MIAVTRETFVTQPSIARYAMPPDLRRILDSDPRLSGMTDPLPGFSPEVRELAPVEVRDVPPAFSLLWTTTDDPFGEMYWTNRPPDIAPYFNTGGGCGLAPVGDRPCIRESRKPPAKRPDIFEFLRWHVASNAFIEVVREFDPQAIEVKPVRWEFAGGVISDRYSFLDVTRLGDAYDYARSHLRVRYAEGKRSLTSMGYPRVLKPTFGVGASIARDSYSPHDVLVTHDLARALVEAGLRGFRFLDLARGNSIELPHVEYME